MFAFVSGKCLGGSLFSGHTVECFKIHGDRGAVAPRLPRQSEEGKSHVAGGLGEGEGRLERENYLLHWLQGVDATFYPFRCLSLFLNLSLTSSIALAARCGQNVTEIIQRQNSLDSDRYVNQHLVKLFWF